MRDYISTNPVFDIVCIDITVRDSIAIAEKIRKLNNHAYIILIATVDISPMMYMKPSIMAGSLLIRVYSEVQMRNVLEEAFRAYLKLFQSDEEKEDVYLIDSREGRQVIPYSQIYYFEARDKKIVVSCAYEEITCYDTISSLEDKLPDYFVRCHRSFIINKKMIKKIVLAQQMIELEKNICIPVSRSYRQAVKELL